MALKYKMTKINNKQKFKILSREDRGREIHEKGEVYKTTLGWMVKSQSGNRSKRYEVRRKKEYFICSCNDYQNNFSKCKHVYAVQFFENQKIDPKTPKVKVQLAYSQNWSSYNKAQCIEKTSFMNHLAELLKMVKQPQYQFGRPTYPLQDMLFGSVMKIYTGFSLRRFTSDMKIAKDMGLVEIVPSYSTISNFMNREEIKQTLERLILLSSAPLVSVEEQFAVDSSGFSTSRYGRWHDFKWGKERKYKIWMKAHVNSGVKTNIVTGITITEGTVNDSGELEPILRQTNINFRMKEVSGDKAYSSKKNLEMIHAYSALPFIPFKSNATGKKGGSAIWSKMYHWFMLKHEDYMEHYSKRSNVETVFHMIKSKFGNQINNKNPTAQVNELLMKFICHNLVVLIHEQCELNIKIDFEKGKIE